MNTWTSHIQDPDRLARIAERDRLAVFKSPSAATSLDHAAKTIAHRAWIGNMMEADESWQSAWAGYGAQLAEQNQREADRQSVVENQRKAEAEADAQKRQRQRKEREESAALAANLVGNYHGVIQAEVSAILGGGL